MARNGWGVYTKKKVKIFKVKKANISHRKLYNELLKKNNNNNNMPRAILGFNPARVMPRLY